MSQVIINLLQEKYLFHLKRIQEQHRYINALSETLLGFERWEELYESAKTIKGYHFDKAQEYLNLIEQYDSTRS